jgi:hypothetical protein
VPAEQPDSADAWLDADLVEPIYEFFRGGQLSPIWEHSEQLREALLKKGKPAGQDREGLANALLRQVPTIELFRQVTNLPKAKNVSLYVLLFPGEGRDNTGIKDLNDKVIGYEYNQKFIEGRIEAIRDIFWPSYDPPPPSFSIVGYDYKTALILSLDKSREDFAKGLVKLDEKLKTALLKILDDAEQDSNTTEAMKAEIMKLRKALGKKGYRFDFYYGSASISKETQSVLDRSFLMVTEALKGAGIARFMAKSASAKSKVGKGLAKGLKPDAKKYDARGKQFDHGSFIKVLKVAGNVKDMIVRNVGWLNIWIDKVWTICLYEYYRRVYVMNPDVVRDARKKKLVPPKLKDGVKYKKYFIEQKDLLEGWLVTINVLDYIKDFLVPEFKKEFLAYHVTALKAFLQLGKKHDGEAVDWDRLIKLLTRDLRLGPTPIPIHGRSSEFLFYANSSDHEAQIFLSMDIRDLGVHVALRCDWWAGSLEVHQPKGVALMMDTFAVSDLINRRRRATYETVVKAFADVFPKTSSPEAAREASKAFDGTLHGADRPNNFVDSVQVMLGGDEIFVAASPYYTLYLCEIIAALRNADFDGLPLDMRTGVSFSRAIKGERPKHQNWEAHDQGLAMATSIMGDLKDYERAQRRMERLIEKLEDNANKRKLADPFRKRLDGLGLTKLFMRHGYGNPWPVSRDQFLYDLAHLTKAPRKELIGGDCKVVKPDGLKLEIARLENDLVNKVGRDNYYMDPPPLVTKLPGPIKWLLDKLLPPEKYPYDDPKKKKDKRDAKTA